MLSLPENVTNLGLLAELGHTLAAITVGQMVYRVPTVLAMPVDNLSML